MKKQKQQKQSILQSITKSLKKPKSRSRKILDIVLVLLVISVVGLIVFENSRHSSITASSEKFKASLEEGGYNVSDVVTNCGNPVVNVAFGESRGHRICRSTVAVRSFASVEEADRIITAANRSIIEIDEHDTKNQELPMLFKVHQGRSSSYGIGVTQKTTGTECHLGYEYDGVNEDDPSIKHQFKLTLSCDDSSWFGRTFL